jgi:signal transduction histidine kinase
VTAAAAWIGSALPQADAWVDHTQAAILRLQQLRSGIDRVRATQTDFLITSDRARLPAYERAKQALPQLFSAVRATTAADPVIDRDLGESGPLTAEWLGRADAVVRRRVSGLAPTAALVDADRRAVTEMRDFVEQLRRTEDRLLNDRIDAVRARGALALWLTLAGGALSLAVLVWGARRSLADLDRRLALEDMRAQIAHHVNHELRGPLHNVITALSLLSRGEEDMAAERRSLWEAALVSADHLKRMADDLLDATRLETGKLAVETSLVDGSIILQQAASASSLTVAARRQITLAHRVPDGLLVNADPVRLRQVVGNLLDNALKFTPPGGRVELTAERAADTVQVTVSDTGPGIPAEDLERVFDRLYQSQRTAKQGSRGLGLGLAICRELVERQGGRIWAESEPGRGSRLRFTIPAA